MIGFSQHKGLFI
uniref:Uncharacterized protein n=1 Tax=Anguilla anguilla TaxID=7936 RepID=A0A0E9VR10_ANGAN